MEMMDSIIYDLVKDHTSETERHIEEAFQKHFGFSLHDIDLREIEWIKVEEDPIQSFRYRGETFLYIKGSPNLDVSKDSQGVKLTYTTQFKEV